MIGKSHTKVAEAVTEQVAAPWSGLLREYWFAVEMGLEVPDRFMTMHADPSTDTTYGQKGISKLVHRFYLDSEEAEHGKLIPMITMYTEGITAFAEALAADESMRDQTQDMILYTGALIHFLTDLCTPMHIGCSRDDELTKRLGAKHHQKLESRIWRRHRNATVEQLMPLPACKLGDPWLLSIAENVHGDYCELPEALDKGNEVRLQQISIKAFQRAVSVSVNWLETMLKSPDLPGNLRVILGSRR